MNVEQIKQIKEEAHKAAYEAAEQYFNDVLGGEDKWTCGFAWVNIYDYDGERLKGNSKVGRMLKKAGIEQDYRRIFSLWNPSGFPVQNIDTLEAGARAAAEVFNKYGFNAYMSSRMD